MNNSQHMHLGLIGNGIGNSRAKSLHEMLGQQYGLNLTYTPMDQQDNLNFDLQAALEKCEQQGYRGLNITHPYKQVAFDLLPQKPDLPATITSVNTIVFGTGGWVGTNTDYTGFVDAFKRNLPEVKPGRVLMVGAGGVGVALAAGMAALEAEELVIYDTEPSRAQALVALFAETTLKVSAIEDGLLEAMGKADGLINATPLGMHQYRQDPFPTQGIGSQQWAFDAVYTPEQTDFLGYCRDKQITTLSGFQLFLHQGINAFKVFTGIDVDADETERLYLQQHPIVQHYSAS